MVQLHGPWCKPTLKTKLQTLICRMSFFSLTHTYTYICGYYGGIGNFQIGDAANLSMSLIGL